MSITMLLCDDLLSVFLVCEGHNGLSGNSRTLKPVDLEHLNGKRDVVEKSVEP